jgi:hypothetical protein
MTKSATRALKLLDWLLGHGLEDRRVSIGCKSCKESKDLLASTARSSWLVPFHQDHEVWMRNPFPRKQS